MGNITVTMDLDEYNNLKSAALGIMVSSIFHLGQKIKVGGVDVLITAFNRTNPSEAKITLSNGGELIIYN